MRSTLAHRERDEVALSQLLPTLGRSHARSSGQHDEQLLISVVVAIGRSLTRRQLPQADPKALASGLVAESRASVVEAALVPLDFELRLVKIRYGPMMAESGEPDPNVAGTGPSPRLPHARGWGRRRERSSAQPEAPAAAPQGPWGASCRSRAPT